MVMRRGIAFWLAVCLAAALLPLTAYPSGSWAADQQAGLKWIEFSMGGTPRRVKAGGIMAIHPDTPFKIKKVETDAWFQVGVKAFLAAYPKIDLYQFQTLTDILGPDVYKIDELVVEARRAGVSIGQVRLMLRLLPIDWLRKARSARKLEDKIAYTQKALELTPDDRLMVKRLVMLLEKAKRYQEAVDLITQYPSGDDGAWALAAMARLYRRLDQPEKEAAALSKLLDITPRDRASLERLADLYGKMGKWPEAALVLERMLPLLQGPVRVSALRRLAEALGKAGKAGQAAQIWDSAVKQQPDNPELWQALAQARAQSGDKVGSLAALKQAVFLAPKDQKLWDELINALLENGDKAEAARSMELQLKLRPEDQALLARLARLYEELGDENALMRTYARLSALRPDDRNLSYNLSLLKSQKHLAAGEDKKAAQALEMALALEPDNKGLMLRLAEIYGRLNDKKAQASIYRRLVELDPKNATLFYNLALLSFELKDYQLALNSLDSAAKLKPDDEEIRELALDVLLKLGKYQRVKELAAAMMKAKAPLKVIDSLYAELETDKPELLMEIIDLGIKQDPKDKKLYELGAVLALDREDTKAAIKVLERGVKALPKDTSLLEKLSGLYEAEGMDEKALAALEKILDRQPDNKKAGERYTRIRMGMLRKKKSGSTD